MHSFSLYRHAHHPPLHSFPTRRSSDLLVGKQPKNRARNFLGLAAAFQGRRLGDARHPAGIAASPSRRDRKSTRLNSSHPSISYAVFCLKKKKKNHTAEWPSPTLRLLAH